MKEVNRYKGEVTLIGGKKQYYFGPTLDETCDICSKVPNMESYKVTNREMGWVAARYTTVNSPDKTPMSLKKEFEKDAQRKALSENKAMKEVAVTSC